jgi:hypothetical protein
MIDSFVFENFSNGTSVAFNTNDIPFRSMTTDSDYRTEMREKSQEHGLWPAYTYLGGRRWQCEGDILDQTSADYMTTRREIKKSLTPAPHLGYLAVGELRVQFSGMEEMFSECTVEACELPLEALSPARGEFMIIWVAFDPRCYSSTLYSSTIGTPGIVGGRTYPKTYPETYSVGSPNDIVVTNLGEIGTFPEVEIHGPVESPEVILIRDGTEYVFILEGLIIPAGDFAKVNFRDRTVVSNLTGADWYRFSHEATWWQLEPGNNTIRFTAFSASAPSQAVIKWRNAYMP